MKKSLHAQKQLLNPKIIHECIQQFKYMAMLHVCTIMAKKEDADTTTLESDEICIVTVEDNSKLIFGKN